LVLMEGLQVAGAMPNPGSMMDPGGAMSLSAQAELELELSLRGSLLVQQQRRIVQLEDELQRAWAEIERLKTKCVAHSNEKDGQTGQPRYWTPEEHTLFMEAVARYGWKDVKAISAHVGTRNPTQVRTHAQKLMLREQKGLASAANREIPPGMPRPVKNDPAADALAPSSAPGVADADSENGFADNGFADIKVPTGDELVDEGDDHGGGTPLAGDLLAEMAA